MFELANTVVSISVGVLASASFGWFAYQLFVDERAPRRGDASHRADAPTNQRQRLLSTQEFASAN